MLVSFVAATLELIAGSGKVPTITLRSIDPITVDGTVADTVNDGRFSVKLSPGQSEWLKARLLAIASDPESDAAVAFAATIRSGSVTMPDASRGKRAAHGSSILTLLPALAEDESDDDGDTVEDESDDDGDTVEDGAEGSNVEPTEPTPEPEPTTDATDAPKGRQRRS